MLRSIYPGAHVRVGQVAQPAVLGCLAALHVPHDPPDGNQSNDAGYSGAHTDDGVCTRLAYFAAGSTVARAGGCRTSSDGAGRNGHEREGGDDESCKLPCDAWLVVEWTIRRAEHRGELVDLVIWDIGEVHSPQAVDVPLPALWNLNLQRVRLHVRSYSRIST